MNKKNHESFARLRSLFERCVDLPAGERESWLDGQQLDTSTRIELELMLAADANDAAIMRRDVVDLIERLDVPAGESESTNLVGRRLGAFLLTRLVGSGGQGTVYEGERVEGGFTQRVAIKLLHRGIHDANEHRRFRREREILARLDDPGIARLIDGGVSAEGVPYLVMEFVDGLTLERWHQQQRPGLDVELALFERLCAIVASAHRALVVHRDLKPANLLVTANGTIKVLDFGIARLLDEDDAGRTGAQMVTPGYCAPEQLSGDAITLSTDVYALGVILRELVNAHGTGNAASRRIRELGWIIARACATEPERRYRDAMELHDDIARFRSARPVQAHPPSRLYAARKFVNRHRGGVTATLLFLLGIFISAGVALWQAKVAREQAQRAEVETGRTKVALARAEAVRDFIVEVFEIGGAGLPRDTLPDTATLLERGRSVALSDGTQSVDVQADMLTTLGRIYLGLQREDRAMELIDEAIKKLSSQSPRNDEAYAIALSGRGSLYGRLGRADEAQRDFDAALELQAARDAESLDVARTLIARGEQRAAIGLVTEAVADYDRALAIEARHAETPLELSAYTQNGLGIALWRAGDCARGEQHLREAVAMSRRIWGSEHMETAGALSGLSLCLTQLMKFQESESVSRESLAMLERVFGKDHPALGQSKNNLANLLIRVGKLEEAEPLLREKLAADHVTGVDEAGSGLNTWINLSNLLRNRGDLDGALKTALKAQEIGRRVAPDAAVGNEPSILLARIALAKSDLAEAQKNLDAYRLWQKSPAGAHAMLPARVDFLEAQVALQRGDLKSADLLVARGLPDMEEFNCADGARAYLTVAQLRAMQGSRDQEFEMIDRAVALCERVGTPMHYANGEALLARAEWHLQQGDRDAARTNAKRADVVLASELPPDHPLRLRVAKLNSRLQ